jgi:hypothetical protein
MRLICRKSPVLTPDAISSICFPQFNARGHVDIELPIIQSAREYSVHRDGPMHCGKSRDSHELIDRVKANADAYVCGPQLTRLTASVTSAGVRQCSQSVSVLTIKIRSYVCNPNLHACHLVNIFES